MYDQVVLKGISKSFKGSHIKNVLVFVLFIYNPKVVKYCSSVTEQRVTTSVSMTVQLLRLKPEIRVAQPPLMKNGGKVYLDG
jgi:hypothetical protein